MTIAIALTLIGLLFILLELIVGIDTGLDLLLIGISLLIGGSIGYFSTDIIGVITSIILSFGYLLVGRKLVKNKINAFSHHSNIDSLLGKTTKVKSWDNNSDFGTVTIDGEIWRAKSKKSLSTGDKVTITNVSGVTLEVEPLEKD